MALVGWFETVNFTQRGLTSERGGGPWYGMEWYGLCMSTAQ